MRAILGASLLATTIFVAPASAREFESVAEFMGPVFADPEDGAAINKRCDKVLAELEARFSALESQDGPYTVESTLKPTDDMGAIGYMTGSQFYSLNQSADTAEKRSAALACTARLSEFGTKVGLSRPLYERLSQIDATTADEATRFLLKQTLEGYERSGVQFDEGKRAAIQSLQKELTDIGNEFQANIAKDRRVIKALPRELAGMPQDWIAAHAAGDDGLIEVSTDNPDFQPVMSYAQDDEFRERLARVYYSRGYPTNSALLGKLFTKRQELAEMLGKPDFATLYAADKMLNSPEKVEAHFAELAEAAAPAGQRDLAELRAALAEIRPEAELTMFNSGIAAQHLLKTKYDLDSQEVREYFTYDNVRDGVFALVEDLFQLDIRSWKTETWHPDVETFEIYDGDALLGRFYLDAHPRDGKYKHGNHIALQRGVKGEYLPVSVLTMNLPKGGYDTGKMEHSDVETFLHEFGHLVHSILAGKQQWFSESGVATEWDFVEAPSQMLEEWVYDYDTLAKFARNEAGEVIPRDLVERMNKARNFGKGAFELGQLGYANVSFQFHRGAPADTAPEAISNAYRAYNNKYALLPRVQGTHAEAAFGHLNGYASGYYTYGWSRVIAADLFSRFKAAGLRDPETAMAYRRLVLEPGGSKPAAELVEDFLGRPVNSEAFRNELLNNGG